MDSNIRVFELMFEYSNIRHIAGREQVLSYKELFQVKEGELFNFNVGQCIVAAKKTLIYLKYELIHLISA